MKLIKKYLHWLLFGMGLIGLIQYVTSRDNDLLVGSIIIIVLGLYFYKKPLKEKETVKQTMVQTKDINSPDYEQEMEQRRIEQKLKQEQQDKARREWLKHGIDFSVAGTSYRQAQIKKIVNEYLIEEYEYEGLTNKEIKEDYFFDKVWQHEPIEVNLTLENEPTNKYNNQAVKVMIGDYHVGYIPDVKLKKYYRLLESKGIKHAYGTIRGGKFKWVDTDDYGNDKVRTDSYDYSVFATIEFNE